MKRNQAATSIRTHLPSGKFPTARWIHFWGAGGGWTGIRVGSTPIPLCFFPFAKATVDGSGFDVRIGRSLGVDTEENPYFRPALPDTSEPLGKTLISGPFELIQAGMELIRLESNRDIRGAITTPSLVSKFNQNR